MKLRLSRLALASVVLGSLPTGALFGQAPPSQHGKPSVAVLSSPSLGDETSVLCAKLDEAGFKLIERADLGLVAREGRISAGQLPDGLDSAEFLVLLEGAEAEGVWLRAIRVLGRDDGQVHSSDMGSAEEPVEKWAQRAAELLESCHLRRVGAKSPGPTVSIGRFAEEFVAGRRENPHFGRSFGSMISNFLASRRSLTVLERSDLAVVGFERQLAEIDAESFEKADFVVSGKVSRGGAPVSVELEVRERGVELHVRRLEGLAGYAEAAEAAAIAVESIAKVGNEPAPPGAAPESVPSFPYDEVIGFSGESRRFLRLGLHDSAAEFARVAQELSDGDRFEPLLLLANAELLEAMPWARGQGVDPAEPATYAAVHHFPKRADGIPALDEVGDDAYWRSLALAAERSADLLDMLLAAHRPSGGQDAVALRSAKARANRLIGLYRSVEEIATESALQACLRGNGPLAGDTLDSLGRMQNARRRLEEAGSSSLRSGGLPTPELDPLATLLLVPSTNEAVAFARELLYPDLPEKTESGEAPGTEEWAKLLSRRHLFFRYFAYLGYDPDNGDTSSPSFPDELVGSSFVGWASGSGITLPELAERAASAPPGPYAALARIDLLFWAVAQRKRSEDRAKPYLALRDAVAGSLGELRGLGILENLALELAGLEKGRRPLSEDPDAARFWSEILAAVYDGSTWASGNLAGLLAGYFDGRQWVGHGNGAAADPQVRAKFLDRIERTLAAHFESRNETIPTGLLEPIQLARRSLGSGIEPAFVDGMAQGGIEGVPEKSTLAVRLSMGAHSYGTLATYLDGEAAYLLQIPRGSRHHEPRLMVFRPGAGIEKIAVPHEVEALVEEHAEPTFLSNVERCGALEVGENKIFLAFPGGLADYDLRSGNWTVTPVDFLRRHTRLAFVGDYIVSSRGRGRHIVNPPVVGLYLTHRSSLEPTAILDTSRVPRTRLLDMCIDGSFPFPALSNREGHLWFALASAYRPGFYRVAFRAGPELEAVPISFGAGAADWTEIAACRSGDHLVFGAFRKRRDRNRSAEDPDLFQVGAFAVRPDGRHERLLDTGTLPYSRKGNLGNGQAGAIDWESRMMPDEPKPIFSFPREFATHSGKLRTGPLFHYDGQRLLMLSHQLTSDGRRLLYVWRDHQQKEPVRLGLRFEGFSDWGIDDPSERAATNAAMRNGILSIAVQWEHLLLEFRYGFFLIPLADLDSALDRAASVGAEP